MLLQRATELERVLFSQDTDLLALADAWQAAQRDFPGVIFAAQTGVSLGRLVDDLELLATCAEPEELANRVIHLPLR